MLKLVYLLISWGPKNDPVRRNEYLDQSMSIIWIENHQSQIDPLAAQLWATWSEYGELMASWSGMHKILQAETRANIRKAQSHDSWWSCRERPALYIRKYVLWTSNAISLAGCCLLYFAQSYEASWNHYECIMQFDCDCNLYICIFISFDKSFRCYLKMVWRFFAIFSKELTFT